LNDKEVIVPSMKKTTRISMIGVEQEKKVQGERIYSQSRDDE